VVYGSESSYPGGRGRGKVDTGIPKRRPVFDHSVASCFIVPRIFTLDNNRRLGFVARGRAPLECASDIWEPASAPLESTAFKLKQ
jgi:hypothetical protein